MIYTEKWQKCIKIHSFSCDYATCVWTKSFDTDAKEMEKTFRKSFNRNHRALHGKDVFQIVTQWCLIGWSIKLISWNETSSDICFHTLYTLVPLVIFEWTKLIENCGFSKIFSLVQYVKRCRFCSHYGMQTLLSTEFDYNLKTFGKLIYLLGCKRSMIALIFYSISIKLWSTVVNVVYMQLMHMCRR